MAVQTWAVATRVLARDASWWELRRRDVSETAFKRYLLCTGLHVHGEQSWQSICGVSKEIGVNRLLVHQRQGCSACRPASSVNTHIQHHSPNLLLPVYQRMHTRAPLMAPVSAESQRPLELPCLTFLQLQLSRHCHDDRRWSLNTTAAQMP